MFCVRYKSCYWGRVRHITFVLQGTWSRCTTCWTRIRSLWRWSTCGISLGTRWTCGRVALSRSTRLSSLTPTPGVLTALTILSGHRSYVSNLGAIVIKLPDFWLRWLYIHPLVTSNIDANHLIVNYSYKPYFIFTKNMIQFTLRSYYS